METLTTMDIAQCPFRHHRTFTCQLTIGGDDFIGRTDKDGIVDGCRYWRTEHGLVLHLVVIKHGLVVLGQLSSQSMATFLQVDYLRGCRRQPQVLHLDDGLSVDAEVMTTGHLLTDIQQQAVIARLSNIDGCLEDVTLADFALATLGRSDIHHLAGSLALTFLQANSLTAGVKLRQSVVVPQNAIAFTRDEHGQRNLGVYLCQAT